MSNSTGSSFFKGMLGCFGVGAAVLLVVGGCGAMVMVAVSGDSDETKPSEASSSASPTDSSSPAENSALAEQYEETLRDSLHGGWDLLEAEDPSLNQSTCDMIVMSGGVEGMTDELMPHMDTDTDAFEGQSEITLRVMEEFYTDVCDL